MHQSAGSCDRFAYVPVRITEIAGLYVDVLAPAEAGAVAATADSVSAAASLAAGAPAGAAAPASSWSMRASSVATRPAYSDLRAAISARSASSAASSAAFAAIGNSAAAHARRAGQGVHSCHGSSPRRSSRARYAGGPQARGGKYSRDAAFGPRSFSEVGRAIGTRGETLFQVSRGQTSQRRATCDEQGPAAGKPSRRPPQAAGQSRRSPCRAGRDSPVARARPHPRVVRRARRPTTGRATVPSMPAA